ncbi:hypothetical protein THIOKS1600015 [Thiocapsa sp. KS1]|nr:hypothetical protein THIOKS1600015 [Thiocapsa sp. KS1]
MSGYLATGGRRDPFLPHLLEAIRRADRIDLAVAFIKSSGLALIFDALADALQFRTARLRILTSDYLRPAPPAIGEAWWSWRRGSARPSWPLSTANACPPRDSFS